MSFPISPTNGQLATVNGIVFSYNSASFSWTRTASALSGVANLVVTNNANLTNIYSSVGNFTGNFTAAGIVGTTYYGQINLGTTSVNLNRTSGSQTLTGVAIDGTAATATNAINTQITSNISSGTAYVSFVNSTSGNVAQNVNTSLTYNPNSGNLRAYGIQTDTGVYWAGNGAAFSSSPGGTSGQLQYNNNNAFTGANIVFNNANGNLVITSTTTSTSSTTGALVVSGGTGINGALYNSGLHESAGNIIAGATTVSTSATTGALVVRGGVGIAGNVFTSGWIIPTSNVSQNLGTTTQWWNVFYGVSTQARYADLAENYQADNKYEPGTVLVFGGENEVTISTHSHDTAVAGVVSTNPAHLMNGALDGENVVALALQGRVPCLVKGPVIKGTVLVSSDIIGTAEALNTTRFQPGCVIGKSLENIPDDSIKLIEVVVGRF